MIALDTMREASDIERGVGGYWRREALEFLTYLFSVRVDVSGDDPETVGEVLAGLGDLASRAKINDANNKLRPLGLRIKIGKRTQPGAWLLIANQNPMLLQRLRATPWGDGRRSWREPLRHVFGSRTAVMARPGGGTMRARAIPFHFIVAELRK